jgi:hypothetical protein
MEINRETDFVTSDLRLQKGRKLGGFGVMHYRVRIKHARGMRNHMRAVHRRDHRRIRHWARECLRYVAAACN